MSMNYNAGPGIFENAKVLRKKETAAEARLWIYLSKNQLGVKFRRQHPINKYIADFYCHAAQLVIELDGSVHNTKEQQEYDHGREFELNGLGLKIIRFTNEEVFNNIEAVLDKIKSEIKSSKI
jgi:imidazole glycerol-phosphate synthase subunit HisF